MPAALSAEGDPATGEMYYRDMDVVEEEEPGKDGNSAVTNQPADFQNSTPDDSVEEQPEKTGQPEDSGKPQEQSSASAFLRHQIGISGSGISGYGLYYQLTLHSLRVKLVGVPMMMDYDGEYWLDSSIGVELQYDFFSTVTGKKNLFRTFSLAGGSYLSSVWKIPLAGIDQEEESWSIGGGLGIEYLFFGRLSVAAHIGYRLSKNITEDTQKAFITGGGSLGVAF